MKMPLAPVAITRHAHHVFETFFGGILRRFCLGMACLAGLPGCATLVTDDQQSIVVTSDPVGATCQVRQGAAYAGTVNRTPGTILVHKSRHDIAIDCTRLGYFPGAAVLEAHFQDMTLGNIIYGGTIGLLVDTSSGAINEYSRWVSVLMKPLTSVETERLVQVDTTRRRVVREKFEDQ